MINEAQDRHKRYDDTHSNDHNHEIGNRVFLWVKPQKSSIKLWIGKDQWLIDQSFLILRGVCMMYFMYMF